MKSAVSKIGVYEWYKHFKDGCEDTEDDKCPDTPAHQQPMKTRVEARDEEVRGRGDSLLQYSLGYQHYNNKSEHFSRMD
ncbi:hypothetical protein J6590_022500 [Homalodisca vitripennis]|nr:hypothetical protein J6590_022500 [Homalodisca vitripennis]